MLLFVIEIFFDDLIVKSLDWFWFLTDWSTIVVVGNSIVGKSNGKSLLTKKSGWLVVLNTSNTDSTSVVFLRLDFS